MKKTTAIASIALLLASACAARAERLSYRDLVGRLTDVERVALLPVEGETTALVSTYNRASRYDEKLGQYVEWGANADGGNNANLKEDAKGELLLADIKGPGCIWRIWAASTGKGRVKFYIDGAEKPAIDMAFEELFSGKHAPFNRPNLTYNAAKGYNSYVPIAFNRSCRIVGEKGWGDYYQFTYSTFPSGTEVPAFTGKLDEEGDRALDEANRLMSVEDDAPAAKQQGEAQTKQVTVEPGSTVRVYEASGSGAITGLRAQVDDLPNRAEQIAALRELALSIRWDGQQKPAVWSPLGDFFGSAMGVNPYRSFLSGMEKDGSMYSRWYMPFGSGAAIDLTNDGTVPRRVTFQVQRSDLKRPAAELGRFHAKYHRDAFNPTRADRWPDWTLLTTEGRGRFCGAMLHVWNPTAGNSLKYGREGFWWWGEGDEKFFVDGEKFPSTFGTGTEDYFGYAWCNPSLFQRAFHGQTLTQNNKGHQVVHRWHLADSVPFQKSFEGALEKYYPNVWPTLYAATSFWYLDPAGTDPYDAVPVADRTGYYDLTDAHEGENLKVVETTGGRTERQQLIKDITTGESILSGGEQLWWREAKIGDKLTVELPVARAGRYRVSLGTVQAADFATIQIELAGKKPLTPVDMFAKTLAPIDIYLGEHELKRGVVPLSLTITGIHRDALKKNLASIDYVKLHRVE